MMKSILLLLLLGVAFTIQAQKQLAKENYVINYPDTWQADDTGMMGTKFIIFSPVENVNDNFRENVNLVTEDISAFDLDLPQYVEASIGRLSSMITDAEMISSEDMGDYHRLVFTGTQGIYQLKFEQNIRLKDNIIYVLTFTSKEDTFDQYKKVGQEIMATFKL